MNASSAAAQVGEREASLANRVPVRGRELEQRLARDAGEDAEVERRREELRPPPPPDVRHRAFEHEAVAGDEDGVVGAARRASASAAMFTA